VINVGFYLTFYLHSRSTMTFNALDEKLFNRCSDAQEQADSFCRHSSSKERVSSTPSD